MRDGDRLHRFLFENFAVRGEIAQLDSVWRAVLKRRDYPAPISNLLGEAMAAAALLSATIKFDGLLTLQIESGGPLKLLVVQCTHARDLRGMARWTDARDLPLKGLCQDGKLAITIDPGGGREQYQGTVALQGPSLANALEGYFARSEQLPTCLRLTADDRAAAGLLLQPLPGGQSDDADAWERIKHLGGTLTSPELLGLDAQQILRRLFHSEDIRLFEAERIGFRCSCSRDRSKDMLRALGYDEIEQVLDECGMVTVTCEFCGIQYEFDSVDAEHLFAAADQPHVPKTRH